MRPRHATSDDYRHMRHALRLASRALGNVAPNPAVGCVLIGADGAVVGRGFTQAGGRPHAETVALAHAGGAARGATAYVTLEPCSHQGQTGPCAQALIDAGVTRVVVAAGDPDPRVNGRGLAMLREAGLHVVSGVCEAEALESNAGFFMRMTKNRPLVTLKIAQSLDGKTASASGDSQWITGEVARAFGHRLRASHDAILIGSGTALADDPSLTCRLPGLEARSPLRVVLDSRARLLPGSKLAQTARQVPTLVFTLGQDNAALAGLGVELVAVDADAHGRPALDAVLKELARRGITRLLVEGGAGVHGAFLDAGFADRLEIFTAPLVLGDGGHGAIAALAAPGLDAAPRFRKAGYRKLGTDSLERYVAAPDAAAG